MPVAPNGNEIFIGSGECYIDRFDASGNRTGYRFLGNCPKFELTPSADFEDVMDMTKNVRTKLAHIAKTQTHTLAIDAEEFQPKNVALAIFGTDAAYVQTGGSVTAEVLASAAGSATVPAIGSIGVGSILQTAQRNISATSLKVTTASTPTTLVLGTDYEIQDAISGMIRILSIASFPGSPTGMTIDYTAAAMTSSANKTMITAATSPQILCSVRFVGKPVAGRAIDVDIWRVALSASAALALIGDNHGAISLTGEILNDSLNHPAQPFYRTIER